MLFDKLVLLFFHINLFKSKFVEKKINLHNYNMNSHCSLGLFAKESILIDQQFT